MLHRMHLVEESKSGSRVAEGGGWGKGVGVVAGRARHQVAGEEDERVGEKDDADCKKEMLWSPGIHSIKEPLLVVVRMTKVY